MKPKIKYGVGVQVHETAMVHDNVQLGDHVIVEAFSVVGYAAGEEANALITRIGAHSRIRTHSVIYAGVTLGAHCHIGHHVIIREHTQIGTHSSVGGAVVIEHHCSIGDSVRIQGQAGLCEFTTIESEAWIGPRVITSNVLHPTCDKAKQCLAGPIIRRGAIVGSSAVLSPDIEIGERALIGAGSIVTKSVANEAIMFGNPARKIGEVDKISCPYELKHESPYSLDSKYLQAEPLIPLVDLQAQHQTQKQELRLALDRVIMNTRFINGPEVVEFEQAYAAFCETTEAIGVSSGTDALILILQALGIGAGDEVITSPHTFIATVEAIHAVGASPVFVDIDAGTFNLDPTLIAARMHSNTKAILPVHLYGRPAEMVAIQQLAKQFNVHVIEDAAQAQGADVVGKKIGGWGDAAAFSFFPGKNLGAYGDAGAITTNDAELAAQMRRLRDHGRMTKYESVVLGGNARLDTLQAAVLKVKLKKLAKRNEQRRQVAHSYRQALAGLPLVLPQDPPQATHVYHQFVITTPERDALAQHLKQKGIATGVHYPVPLHLQPALKAFGYRAGDFPHAEAAANSVLSLPMYPELSPKQIDRVTHGIIDFYETQNL